MLREISSEDLDLGELIDVDEFVGMVVEGEIDDSDGYAFLVVDNEIDDKKEKEPSQLAFYETIPDEIEHILWFRR